MDTTPKDGPAVAPDRHIAVASRAWIAYVAISAVAAVVLRVVGLGTAAHALLALGAVGAAVAGIRLHRPPSVRLWWRFVSGLAAYAVASAVWFALADAGRWQLIGDALHGVGFLLIASTLLAVLRVRVSTPDRDGLVDAGIVTVSAAVATWVLVMQPLAADATTPLLDRLVALSYPLMNLALMPLLVRLVTVGRRSAALRLFVGSLTIAVGAGLVFAAYETLGGTPGPWLEYVYEVGYVLSGAATLHPSMVTITRGAAIPPRILGRRRFRALAAASLVPTGVLLLQYLRGGSLELPIVVTGTVAVFALVAVRMWGLIGQVADLTAQRGEERFRALVHNADDVIVVLDTAGRISFATPSVVQWGYDPTDLVGCRFDEFTHHDDIAMWSRRSRGGQGGAMANRFHGRLRTADGTWREVDAVVSDLRDDDHVNGVLVTIHDVTDRNRLQRQLAHQALHDPLTGLANRTLFLQRLEQSVGFRQPEDDMVAVLFLDLDDFKGINDGLGHEAGDQLLMTVARRIASSIREGDTAARFGGDEFAVLLGSVASPEEADAVAERILREVQAPMTLAGHQMMVRASIGVAAAHRDAAAPTVMRHADTAMYAAKAGGKGQVKLYDPDLLRRETRRRELLADLPQATNGQLHLVYQPVVDLKTVAARGVEALLRWTHPTLGPVSPGELIPLAEQSGAIVPIGRWVLETACREALPWQQHAAAAGQPFHLSVNLSVVQLRDIGLADDVAAVLRETGFPAEHLTLEVTESVLAGEETGERLLQLKDLGLRIAVDDFGTGYSSLRYLQRFPLDVLKIDRAFVDTVTSDPTLTRAIIGLADALGLESLAEGIETDPQLEQLRKLACSLGQGYLFARPLPRDEVERILLGGPAVAGSLEDGANAERDSA